MRFDVLLHELRLYKSRSQAAAAIEEGRALLDGASVKPSREARAGQRITLIEAGRRRSVEILDLPRGGLSKEAARGLVREVAE
ncbi:MAG TPA: S4 domain-containing protein [Candidatus Sulfotelmatobacter sp.]|nr:S4 domain-containing protein [Candidatus Sulfotelmatobacter sp.]